MRILFVNRFYAPDRAGTALVLADLAEDLAAAGLRVSVLASDTAGRDTSARLPRREAIRGVEVRRVRAGRFNRNSVAGWAVNAFLFYPAVFLRLLFSPRRDATVFLTDPPLIFILGPLVRLIRGGRFAIWSQDVYPDVAIGVGVLREKGVAARIAGRMAGWAYGRADLVIALGDRMAERLVARGAKRGRVKVIHNWADGDRVRPVAPAGNRFLRRHGLEGKFVVGYSGNFGLSHEFSTILGAGRRLRGGGDIVFLIIGEGKRYRQVKEDAGDLDALFLPFQPESVLPESLSAACVHVVTLKNGLEGALVPSKIYGVLAAGRPVIFVGPPECEAARIVEEARCGLVVAPGDVDGFVAAVTRLKAAVAEREAMGRRAREVFERKYDRKIATERFRAALGALDEGGGPGDLEGMDER